MLLGVNRKKLMLPAHDHQAWQWHEHCDVEIFVRGALHAVYNANGGKLNDREAMTPCRCNTKPL